MARNVSRQTRSSRTPPHDHTMMRELLQRNLPVLARSMTFAKMVQANAAFSHIIKDLGWLFPPVWHRKDQEALTDTDRSRYMCAFSMINSDGTLGQLIDIHAEMHMQHTNARLLPRHRVFVCLFEEALHNYHPDVCVPYRDWTRPQGNHQNPPLTGPDAVMDPSTYIEADVRSITRWDMRTSSETRGVS